MSSAKNAQTAAIVCGEIANSKAPILYAERAEPEDPADSGWQFLCGIQSEDWESAQVWALHEVVEYDGSLLPFVEFPVGTVLRRRTFADAWTVRQTGDEG